MNDPSVQLYLLTGNDDSQIGLEAERLFQEVAGPDPDPFVCDVVQETDAGATPDLIHKVIGSVRTPPFLGGTKIVRLKHFTGFAAEGGSSGIDKALKSLAKLISDGLPAGVVLFLDGPGCDGRKAFFRACAAKGRALVFNKPAAGRRNWREEMAVCVRRAAERKGIALSRAAQDTLVEVLGAETANLDAELEKIICYCGGPDRPITPEDIREICVGMSEEQNWAINDCLGARDLDRTIAMAEQLLAQSKNPDATARTLTIGAAGFFRLALQLRIFMREQRLASPAQLYQLISDTPPADRRNFPGFSGTILAMHPFRARKTAEQAARYAPAEIIKALELLRDALWQTTSSSTSPAVALENALYRIIGTTAGRDRRR